MLRRGRASDFAYGAPVREQSETGQASTSLSRFRDLLPSRHGRPARHRASGIMASEWLEHAGGYGAPQGDLARETASGPARNTNQGRMAIDPGATPSMRRLCPAGGASDPWLTEVSVAILSGAKRGTRGSRGLFRSTLFFSHILFFFCSVQKGPLSPLVPSMPKVVLGRGSGSHEPTY